MAIEVVVDNTRHGRGIFAPIDIAADTAIMQFQGNIVYREDVISRGDLQCYPVQVGPDKYVDIGEPERFINHSCDPNSGLTSDLLLISIKPISSGDQITFDYSTTMNERFWTMNCDCRSPICRGIVQDFDLLPVERQQYYLKRSIVQNFIAEEVGSSIIA